jgi:hypothetical protein
VNARGVDPMFQLVSTDNRPLYAILEHIFFRGIRQKQGCRFAAMFS